MNETVADDLRKLLDRDELNVKERAGIKLALALIGYRPAPHFSDEEFLALPSKIEDRNARQRTGISLEEHFYPNTPRTATSFSETCHCQLLCAGSVVVPRQSGPNGVILYARVFV